MRKVRLMVPVMLASVGMMLLWGCIPVFTGDRLVVGDRNYAAAVGDEKSGKPIRVNLSTRKEVLQVLGYPVPSKANRFYIRDNQDDNRDPHKLIYHYTTVNGYWIMPLCFQAPENRIAFSLTLTFDDSEVLRSYKLDAVGNSDDFLSGYYPNHQTQSIWKTGKWDGPVGKNESDQNK